MTHKTDNSNTGWGVIDPQRLDEFYNWLDDYRPAKDQQQDARNTFEPTTQPISK